ncbi:hypothetical protein U1Q18_026079 [Sarracenia purpurea var. burkii]
MDFNSSGQGPAILQLYKWDTSEVQLNLSEFREAFISPTREILLLLSHHYEALLLPLVKGQSIDCKDPENCYDGNLTESKDYKDPESCSDESLQTPSFCSPVVTALSHSYLGENISSTSESVKTISDNDFSRQIKFSSPNSYPFVCDVNSLTWGMCGDSYKRHEDALFRELLFVSGSHGVTAHAFRRPRNSSERAKPIAGREMSEGRWMEWGPPAALVQTKEAVDDSTLHCEAFADAVDVTRTNITGEGPNGLYMEVGDDELPRNVASKRWLRTFLTKVETTKSDGNVWTGYPMKTSFPSSATVVSFRIFDSDSPLLDFLPHTSSVSHKNEGCDEPVPVQVNNAFTKSGLSSSSVLLEPNVKSDFVGCGMTGSYKCSKLFSSNSHHLIGFVLKLMDTLSANSCGLYEGNRSKTLLLVAKLESCGIQWVCSVKLNESVDMGIAIEWTDFGFSDNFLICLNEAGKIYFYGAITGEYVAHVDILQIGGFHHQLISEQQNNQDDGVDNKSSSQTGGFFGRRMFRRLLIASHTSVLAVIDEHGVVYVVWAGDYIPTNCRSFEKQLPQFEQLGLGILIGWEAGGADISCQRKFSYFHGSHKVNASSGNKSSSFIDYMNSNELLGIQESYRKKKGIPSESYMTVFSVASQIIDNKFSNEELSSRHLRKIFLPTEKFHEDDVVCFSNFGVTRLFKRRIKEKKGCQIVHSHLFVDSTVSDDRCFNLRGWEDFVGEAVGCTFQGCFYLVTEGGLSVILPSVSISSNFLPAEAIGFTQPSVSLGVGLNFGNHIEMKGSKLPWLPWKVEILDRALLYEGPGEADRLCLENGWGLRMSRTRRLQLALHYLKFEEIEK